MTRSADKRFLALAGYNAGLTNGTALQNTLSADVPRGVVTIEWQSQVTLAIADTNAYSAAHFRGAATDGTNNFWGSGSAEGTYYFGLNSSAGPVQTIFPNTRSVDIFNGKLYCVSAQSGNNGVMEMDGLPTGAATVNILFAGSASTTDLAVNSNRTLIYVTSNGGIHRWEYDGSTWTNAYTLNSAISEGARYVTADFSGATPLIYATTVEANGLNRLVRIVDTNSTATATTLATSGPNQLFKGIRFGPSQSAVVLQPTLLFSRDGSNLILNWSGTFTLQSATNVTGPYMDVPSATSPHTNSTTSPAQQFFRLRN